MTGSPYEDSMLHFNMRDEVKKLGLLIQEPNETRAYSLSHLRHRKTCVNSD